MKKSKFIAGALVLSMGLLGTGYAYWTDALYVNTSVSTGSLAVDFVEVADGAMYTATGLENEWINKGDSIDGMIIHTPVMVTEDTLTWNINNLHPGAEQSVTVKFKNNGTIPARLIASSPGGVDGPTNGIVYDVTTVYDGGRSHTEEGISGGALVDAINTSMTYNPTTESPYPDKGLQPQEERTLTIEARVNDVQEGQAKEDELNLTFNWTQYNDVALTEE